jgi:LPXTG-site transpeptidase (sortase) family protein
MKNPLIPSADSDKDKSYLLPPASRPQIKPLPRRNMAAELIRSKLAEVYREEPAAKAEIKELEGEGTKLSKHQRYMRDLSTSGKSLAKIQTDWHNYYQGLPDNEKHEVWREFYEANAKNSHYSRFVEQTGLHPAAHGSARVGTFESPVASIQHQKDVIRSKGHPRAIRSKVLRKINQQAKTEARQSLHSLFFGLSLGVVVLFIFLFGFFNQIIIAPFIQPSRHVLNTPLIVSAASVTPNSTPEVIIPKINLEIPVTYSATSDNENVIENDLLGGVVHYPSTVNPGQNGNAAFFGHSSNNIFNPGQYKFAFVLLHTLVKGDTFYLTYQGTIYVYQVIDTRVVPPTDVGILGDSEGHQATATLITCDPPGTSINRLAVTGVQISPNPSGDQSAPFQTVQAPTVIASNGPSLWHRLTHWITDL